MPPSAPSPTLRLTQETTGSDQFRVTAERALWGLPLPSRVHRVAWPGSSAGMTNGQRDRKQGSRQAKAMQTSSGIFSGPDRVQR